MSVNLLVQELDKLGRNLHLSEKRLNSIKGEYSNFLEQVQNQIYKTEENIRELEYGKNLIENLDFGKFVNGLTSFFFIISHFNLSFSLTCFVDVCGLMKFAYRIACQKVSFGRPPYPTEDLMRRTYLFDDQIKNIYKSQIPLISNDLIKDEKIKGELIETDSKETMMRESQIVKREKNVVINLDIESDGMNTEADE